MKTWRNRECTSRSQIFNSCHKITW